MVYYCEMVIVGMGVKVGLLDVFYIVVYFFVVVGLLVFGCCVGCLIGVLFDVIIFVVGLVVLVVIFYMVFVLCDVFFGFEGLLLVGLYVFGSILLFVFYVV